MTREKVLIIGAGIAGPVAAMALQKVGIEATIYEAYQTTAHGVGLQMGLAVNGLDGLRTLGIHEAVKAAAIPTPLTVMWNGSGKCLGEVPGGTALSDRTVNVTIRRADLYAVLADEAQRRGIRTEHGKRLVDAEERGREVVAKFADGSEATGSVLIGADGMGSHTRQLIASNAPRPYYVGLIGTGGNAPAIGLSPTPGKFHMMFGKQAFFGHTVLEDGTIWWFANLPWSKEPSQAELAAMPSAIWKPRLAHLFADDKSPASQIIQATRHDLEFLSMHSMEPPKVWYRDRMVLVGDAAHVTSPSSGQGASLAIEDALVLARCLRDRDEPSTAFAAYQQLRHERIQKVIAGARRVNNSKATGPVGRIIRDALFPLFLRWLTKPSTNAWLYNYHIEFDQPISKELTTA
jgi:2-polyprenyl-6-methoxyphenol hydroxylase-like FAD-dependent oxidoreductase